MNNLKLQFFQKLQSWENELLLDSCTRPVHVTFITEAPANKGDLIPLWRAIKRNVIKTDTGQVY